MLIKELSIVLQIEKFCFVFTCAGVFSLIS